MSHRLDSAWAKLGRAYDCLNVLEDKTRPFIQTNSHEVTVKFDSNTSEHVFEVSLGEPVRTEEWGLIIGDCVHNARCALDHSTWQLAELCTGIIFHDTRTQFPIFADQKLFQNAAPRMLWRIHTNGRTMIEGLQPFTRPQPEDEALWLLHNLDVTDKHRFLLPTLYLVSGMRYWFVSDDRYKISLVGHVLPGPLKNNTEFARMKITDIRTPDGQPVHNPEVKVEGKPNIRISLEDWVIGRPNVFVPLLETLGKGLMEVASILRHFDAHFQREFGLPSIAP